MTLIPAPMDFDKMVMIGEMVKVKLQVMEAHFQQCLFDFQLMIFFAILGYLEVCNCNY